MALELQSFADGEGGNTDAPEAEMVRAIVVAGLWMRIGLYRKAELFCDLLYFRIERRSFRAAHFHFFGHSYWRERIVVQIKNRYGGQLLQVFTQEFRSE